MAAKNHRTIHTSGERYSCHSCGRCCTRWQIAVDADRVAQLRRHDWSKWVEGDPFVPDGKGGFFLKMVDGRCVFLAGDNRCRIHSELRYDDKPASCRAFPLHFAKIGEVALARLSFYCPAVCANDGRPIDEQGRWLQTTLKEAGDVGRTAPFSLDGRVAISAAEVQRIQERIVDWLKDPFRPMEDRMLACAQLLRTLSSRTAATGKRAIDEVLQGVKDRSIEEVARDGRRDGSPSGAGAVLSLFLGQDTATLSRLSRVGRFFHVRLAALGLCALYSGSMDAAARWSALRRVAFTPEGGSDALHTRAIVSKVRSGRWLMGDMSLVTGFNLVVVGYYVIHILACLRAASMGRSTCDDEDVTRAVQAADLLVFEHANLIHNPVSFRFISSMLESTDLCASMAAYVKGSSR